MGTGLLLDESGLSAVPLHELLGDPVHNLEDLPGRHLLVRAFEVLPGRHLDRQVPDGGPPQHSLEVPPGGPPLMDVETLPAGRPQSGMDALPERPQSGVVEVPPGGPQSGPVGHNIIENGGFVSFCPGNARTYDTNRPKCSAPPHQNAAVTSTCRGNTPQGDVTVPGYSAPSHQEMGAGGGGSRGS
jgi:hypothetical protein